MNNGRNSCDSYNKGEYNNPYVNNRINDKFTSQNVLNGHGMHKKKRVDGRPRGIVKKEYGRICAQNVLFCRIES